MDLRRRARRRSALSAVFIILSLPAPAAPAAPAAAGAAPVVHGPYVLAPGVKLWRLRYSTPHQVRVLQINPSQATIDVAASAEQFGTLERVSKQAVANGALAAINGDFGSNIGVPTHPSMIDAVLRTSGHQKGSIFSVAVDGRRAWAKPSSLSIEATTPGHVLKVWRLNAGDANHERLVAWSVVGDEVEHPVTDMCAARLVPDGPYRWSDAENSGVARSYVVEEQPDPCVFARMTFAADDDPGELILQAPRECTCGKRIQELDVGDPVDLAWTTAGRPSTTDVIGGTPQLVRAGKNVAPGPGHPGSFFKENPRTGVGITQGCTDFVNRTICYVYFITVDGRQLPWSRGMTLPRFADEFLAQSPPAYYAFNLDGGGSTEMWLNTESGPNCQLYPAIGGCIVNRPSSGHERHLISSLLVLPGPDSGEPI